MTDAGRSNAGLRHAAALVVLLALWGAAGWAQEAGSAATAVVEQLQAALLDAMRSAQGQDFAQRYATLEPVIRRTHDLDTLTRIVVGRSVWRQLSEAQRRQAIDAFSRLSIATYAHAFKGYSGESFRILGDEATKRGNRLVRTVLSKGDGGKVELDYILRDVDGDWRIVNVIADGVSDLALKRAEYARILSEDGFDAWLARLDEKVRDLGQQHRPD